MNIKKFIVLVLCFSVANGMEQKSLSVEYAYSLRANGKGWREKNGNIFWRQEDKVFCKKKDDSLFISLFDGHGGEAVSQELKKNFYTYFEKSTGASSDRLKDSFEKADNEIPIADDFNYVGSTALVAVLERINSGDCSLTVAHVGDSRAVLECRGKVSFATEDHSCHNKDEQKRVNLSGGQFNYQNGSLRVGDTGLEVTRTIGDKMLRGNLVISTPDISEKIILTPDNKFIVFASDGIWSCISNKEAIAIVSQAMDQTVEELRELYPDQVFVVHEGNTLKDEPDQVEEFSSDQNEHLGLAARALRDEAVKRGSKDNIAAIIIKLEWGNSEPIILASPKEDSLWLCQLSKRKYLIGVSSVAFFVLSAFLYCVYKNKN